MALTATERLLRVLELEEKQGWRNRAVVGGMQGMADRWREDALVELSDQHKVDSVTQLMDAFDQASVDDRPEIAQAIIRTLEGRVDAGSELPQAAEVTSAQATGSPTSAAVPVADVPPLQPTDVAETRAGA